MYTLQKAIQCINPLCSVLRILNKMTQLQVHTSQLNTSSQPITQEKLIKLIRSTISNKLNISIDQSSDSTDTQLQLSSLDAQQTIESASSIITSVLDEVKSISSKYKYILNLTSITKSQDKDNASLKGNKINQFTGYILDDENDGSYTFNLSLNPYVLLIVNFNWILIDL